MLQGPLEAHLDVVVPAHVPQARSLLDDHDACAASLLEDLLALGGPVRSRALGANAWRLAEQLLRHLDRVIRVDPGHLGCTIDLGTDCAGHLRSGLRGRVDLDDHLVGGRVLGGACSRSYERHAQHHGERREESDEILSHLNPPRDLVACWQFTRRDTTFR